MIQNKIDSRYECYQNDLLLHSMSNYMFQLKKCLDVIKPKSITEIGIEGGKFSKYLLQYAEDNSITYRGVEPYPSDEIKELVFSFNQKLFPLTSLDERVTEALSSDVIFVDGDHNYYTVLNELKSIYTQNKDAMVFLHDVSWPCARRDQYYSPDNLSVDDVHEYTFEGGIVPGQTGIQEIGFSGAGQYAYAVEEGGDRNGVRTAIDDFLKDNPEYKYIELLSVFGLGIVYSENCLDDSRIEFFRFFKSSLELWNPLFVNLEENRINLLVELWEHGKVIEDQNNLITELNSRYVNRFINKIQRLIQKIKS